MLTTKLYQFKDQILKDYRNKPIKKCSLISMHFNDRLSKSMLLSLMATSKYKFSHIKIYIDSPEVHLEEFQDLIDIVDYSTVTKTFYRYQEIKDNNMSLWNKTYAILSSLDQKVSDKNNILWLDNDILFFDSFYDFCFLKNDTIYYYNNYVYNQFGKFTDNCKLYKLNTGLIAIPENIASKLDIDNILVKFKEQIDLEIENPKMRVWSNEQGFNAMVLSDGFKIDSVNNRFNLFKKHALSTSTDRTVEATKKHIDKFYPICLHMIAGSWRRHLLELENIWLKYYLDRVGKHQQV